MLANTSATAVSSNFGWGLQSGYQVAPGAILFGGPVTVGGGAAPFQSTPPPPPADPEATFENLVEVFEQDYLPLLKPRAALRYRVSIKALRISFGGLTLGQITKKRIWDFITLRRKSVKTPTIRRDLACLSSMFEQAKAREWLIVNIVRDLDLRHIKESQSRTRYLSKDEEARLIAAAAPYLQPMIIFAIETGFRLSEQMELEWSQVDTTREEVTLIKTKTDSPRVVPLTPRALEVLKTIPRRASSTYVFCKSDGSRYLNLKKGFKGAMRRAASRISAGTTYDEPAVAGFCRSTRLTFTSCASGSGTSRSQ